VGDHSLPLTGSLSYESSEIDGLDLHGLLADSTSLPTAEIKETTLAFGRPSIAEGCRQFSFSNFKYMVSSTCCTYQSRSLNQQLPLTDVLLEYISEELEPLSSEQVG
jgi:hypothetical protein